MSPQWQLRWRARPEKLHHARLPVPIACKSTLARAAGRIAMGPRSTMSATAPRRPHQPACCSGMPSASSLKLTRPLALACRNLSVASLTRSWIALDVVVARARRIKLPLRIANAARSQLNYPLAAIEFQPRLGAIGNVAGMAPGMRINLSDRRPVIGKSIEKNLRCGADALPRPPAPAPAPASRNWQAPAPASGCP